MNLHCGGLLGGDGDAEQGHFPAPAELADVHDSMQALVMRRKDFPLERVPNRRHNGATTRRPESRQSRNQASNHEKYHMFIPS